MVQPAPGRPGGRQHPHRRRRRHLSGQRHRRRRPAQPALRRGRPQPSSHFLEDTSYLHAMLVEAGCTTLSVDACHLPGQTPGGQLSRQAQYSKSDFFDQSAELHRDRRPPQRGGKAAHREPGRERHRRRGLRLPGRRGQPGQPRLHRVRAPGRPVPGPVHDRLAQRRARRRGQPPAGLAAVVLRHRPPLRQRAGVPELHRPQPDQLEAGLLRRQLPPAGPGQGPLRPGRCSASRRPSASRRWTRPRC